VTDEYGAMVNDEWQVKTEETQRQTSFIAITREENKFLSVFLSLKGVLPLCHQAPNVHDIHQRRKINESAV